MISLLRQFKRKLSFVTSIPEKNYIATLMLLAKMDGETLLRTEGKISEYQFWDRWFATEGLQWKQEYIKRLLPDSIVAAPHSDVLDQLSRHFKLSDLLILDVGAGPLTCINKTYQGIKLDITAIDLLADLYDDLLKKYGVDPPIRTQRCKGENIAEMFPEESFHWINATNTLDHMDRPADCIASMTRLLKPGGMVSMFHIENEGKNEKYRGFHQWDFFLKDGSFCMSRQNNRDFRNIAEELPPGYTMKTKMSENTEVNERIEVYITRSLNESEK